MRKLRGSRLDLTQEATLAALLGIILIHRFVDFNLQLPVVAAIAAASLQTTSQGADDRTGQQRRTGASPEHLVDPAYLLCVEPRWRAPVTDGRSRSGVPSHDHNDTSV